MVRTFIPSPPQGVWHLGPVPVRAYALCILLGIVVAIWYGDRRWRQRGGKPGTVGDVAVWAVPFGIVGGRLYHLITDHQIYWGPGGRGTLAALKIWDGGLGIWGAIALGGVGAWIATRRLGIKLPPLADAIAPAIVLAQAIGRWGNWFNQELFGRPTTLPWGLRIDPAHRPLGYEQYATFHPTFLYESIWCVGVAIVVVWADRKWRMGHGRAFALYVLLYTIGRGWIESLRIDSAHHIWGLRLNDWTSIIVAVGALVYIVVSARLHPGREEVIDPRMVAAAPAEAGADEGSGPDSEPGEPADVPAPRPAGEAPAEPPNS